MGANLNMKVFSLRLRTGSDRIEAENALVPRPIQNDAPEGRF
jgi:hypothetical protein